MAAVEQNGLALKFANLLSLSNPQAAKKIVLAAVKQNAEALEFTELNVNNDDDILKAAELSSNITPVSSKITMTNTGSECTMNGMES